MRLWLGGSVAASQRRHKPYGTPLLIRLYRIPSRIPVFLPLCEVRYR